MDEFQNRVDRVAGNDIHVWQCKAGKMSEALRGNLEQWIERWDNRKTMKREVRYGKRVSADAFWYSKYYYSTYLPYSKD